MSKLLKTLLFAAPLALTGTAFAQSAYDQYPPPPAYEHEAPPPPAYEPEHPGVKQDIKHDAHQVKRGAKTAKNDIKYGAKDAWHGVKDGAHEAKDGIKRAFKGDEG